MYSSNTGLIRNYINPILGDVNVQDVDARVVDRFIHQLQRTKTVEVMSAEGENRNLNLSLPVP